MTTEEFQKAVLPDIPLREGDKVMSILRERDERIQELTNYYKSLEKALHRAQYPDPLGDYAGHHEPFKFQYAHNDQERSDMCSIGRENRPD